MKPVMNQKQHAVILIKLNRKIQIEACLRALCKYEMDKTFPETRGILEAIEILTDDQKFGEVADWIGRQWINRQGSNVPTVHPREFPATPESQLKIRSTFVKSPCLRLELLKDSIQEKIRRDPVRFQRERDIERLQCFYFPVGIHVSPAPPASHMRGIKRRSLEV